VTDLYISRRDPDILLKNGLVRMASGWRDQA